MAEQIAEVSGVGGEKRDRTYSSSLLDLKTVTNGKLLFCKPLETSLSDSIDNFYGALIKDSMRKASR